MRFGVLLALLLVSLSLAASPRHDSQKPAGKFANRCNASLDSALKLVPEGSYQARVTWAEAKARADELERFEKEMPKSDLLPRFAEACSLYVELIGVYIKTDAARAENDSLWQRRANTMKEIEETAAKIGDSRSDKIKHLNEDLAATKNQAEESTEQMRRHAEELIARANAREDSLKKAAEAREDSLKKTAEARTSELERELKEERAKAEARQKEAKDKLNKLRSKLIQVNEDARGIILSMSDILFDVDKATLKQDLKTSLAKVAGILSVYQELNVSVEGHTDNQGSAEYNMKLSEQRAKNVLDFLESQGIEAKRLTYKGYGMTRPIGDNSTKEGRQKNRRVDLVIQDKTLQEAAE